MDQKSFLAITAMLNSFPQGQATDPELLLRTYEAALDGVSAQAITETAQRYVRNDIPDQHTTFAPSIAEFVTAARRQEEFISIRNRPRIASQPPKPLPPSPPVQRRTEAERARATEIMRKFKAAVEADGVAAQKAERADIRARYGMTPEVLAAIKDQPLPEGMVQVGQSIGREVRA